MPTDEPRYGGHTAAELLALEKAATPGPWEVESHSGSAEGCYISVESDPRGTLFDTLNAGSVRTIYSPEDSESGWFEEGESADNLRLCAAARNALPHLLAEIARLRSRVNVLELAIAEATGCEIDEDGVAC
jgi:hypothetical protein